MAEQKEQFGLVAEKLRVKITREPQAVGRVYKVPGQIGFKRRDGQWDNYWVDVLCWPEQGERLNLVKGEVVFVQGNFKMEEHTYNDVTKTQYTIWATDIRRQADAQDRQSAPPQAERRQQARQQDDDLGPAFPSEASGMDDVPFALILAPLAALGMALLAGGLVA